MTGRIVGIDVGGTHTDCVLVDPDDGTVTIAKLPTTTEDPSAGFLDGLSRLWAGVGKSVGTIVHGTTIATNAVLERRGARCGLITTGGFRDVLELGRRIREHVYGLTGGFEPLIPRELRLEVRERMDASGDVLIPLHEEDVQAAVRHLREADVEAVVIHFLHAYANPSHERRCRKLVLDAWPGIDVSLGSDVLPEFREFERGTAAAISGYVQPLIGRYVDRLETRLREIGLGERLQIMKSNGGMIRAGLARSQAAQLVLSGPAAGAVAAGRIARAAGFRDAVACDMGGTSFDVTLVRDGEPTLTHEKELGYGLPLHVPMIDVHTIGAGGGSVAWVDAGGLLRVGPESAGAYPGPVAYGRGGTRPTVTDANLLLGRMDPAGVNGVPGGADLDAAARAMERHVAEPLGLDVEEAAEAVLEIVNNAMAGTIRAAALARGLDPRSLALIAFGGAAPCTRVPWRASCPCHRSSCHATRVSSPPSAPPLPTCAMTSAERSGRNWPPFVPGRPRRSFADRRRRDGPSSLGSLWYLTAKSSGGRPTFCTPGRRTSSACHSRTGLSTKPPWRRPLPSGWPRGSASCRPDCVPCSWRYGRA